MAREDSPAILNHPVRMIKSTRLISGGFDARLKLGEIQGRRQSNDRPYDGVVQATVVLLAVVVGLNILEGFYCRPYGVHLRHSFLGSDQRQMGGNFAIPRRCEYSR